MFRNYQNTYTFIKINRKILFTCILSFDESSNDSIEVRILKMKYN